MLRVFMCVFVPAVVCDTNSHWNNKANQIRPLQLPEALKCVASVCVRERVHQRGVNFSTKSQFKSMWVVRVVGFYWNHI